MGSRFQSALKQAEVVASMREGVHKGMLNDPPLAQNQAYPCRCARPLFLGRVPFAVSYHVGPELWMA